MQFGTLYVDPHICLLQTAPISPIKQAPVLSEAAFDKHIFERYAEKNFKRSRIEKKVQNLSFINQANYLLTLTSNSGINI